MRVGSTFTGGGGLDMAVRMLWPDAELAWFCEAIDLPDPMPTDRKQAAKAREAHRSAKAAAAVFTHHHPGVPNLGDITKVDWTQVEPVDVIVGGFPCQDLSTAGARAGLREGTRSGLWYRLADAIEVLRPRLVLLENVAGICSAKGDDDDADCDVDEWGMADGGDGSSGALGAVLGSLASLGFDAEWGVLRAADVGACHGRARWFCVAWDPTRERVEGLGDARFSDAPSALAAELSDSAGPGLDRLTPLLKTPTSNLGSNGGSQHPDKRKQGGHGPTLADEIKHLLPTPKATNNENRQTEERYGPNLGMALRQLLPTPTATEPGGTAEQYRDRWRKSDGRESGYLPLPQFVDSLLPTPNASDERGWRRNGDCDLVNVFCVTSDDTYPAGHPITHSTNGTASLRRSSVGDGTGRPNTTSWRAIASAYAFHRSASSPLRASADMDLAACVHSRSLGTGSCRYRPQLPGRNCSHAQTEGV